MILTRLQISIQVSTADTCHKRITGRPTNTLDKIRQNTPNSTPAHGRTLILVGGALADNDFGIYGKIIDQAGGKGVARIGIITTASIPVSQDPLAGTPQAVNSVADAKFYANLLLNKYGAAAAEWIPIDLDHLRNNSSPAVIKQINSMTGFFFGGGDQSRILSALYLNSAYSPNRIPSPALLAIRKKWDAGAVIAGTSAGNDAQTQFPMITGGDSYEGIKYGAFPYQNLFNVHYLTYNPIGALGFFPYGLIDSHVSPRGREGRLIRLAADTHTQMAFGMDENTALFVTNADTPKAHIEIIGQSGAYIIDMSHAHVTSTANFWTISGVKLNYLTVGDSFDPVTKTADIAGFKTPLVGHEQHKQAITSNDIFDSSLNTGTQLPEAFTTVSTYLFNSLSTSTFGLTFENNPHFEVLMTKGTGSAGYIGILNKTSYISYINLNIDIFPK